MIGEDEVEWRALLVKRLKSAQTVLKRDVADEEKHRTEAKQLAAGYPNYEEAHEAFGWGYITEKQLRTMETIFNEQANQSRLALRRMTEIIGNIEGEIAMLRSDAEYRREVLPDIDECELAAAT